LRLNGMRTVPRTRSTPSGSQSEKNAWCSPPSIGSADFFGFWTGTAVKWMTSPGRPSFGNGGGTCSASAAGQAARRTVAQKSPCTMTPRSGARVASRPIRLSHRPTKALKHYQLALDTDFPEAVKDVEVRPCRLGPCS
jgi:hypothetical protein